MKQLHVLLFFIVLVSAPVYAQIYQWVDENGVRHFSESPRGTPDDAYPVKSKENKTSITEPGNEKRVNVKQETIQKKEPAERQEKGWPACNSELCEKVKKIDTDCVTPDCLEAVRFTSDCKTILCLSDKIDFEKLIDDQLKDLQKADTPKKVTQEPAKEEKEKLSDKEVLEKCKKERNSRCRKNLEYYRVIYNGNSEERKEAWQGLRDAMMGKDKKKAQ